MAAISRIKPGDVLWDAHKERMGNTRMTRLGCWPVKVIEVDLENRKALCSWNGNTPEWYRERRLSKLRRSKPKDAS